MQFKNPENYNIVKEALIKAHREDLIGFDKKSLIPPRPIKANANSKFSKRKRSKVTSSKSSPEIVVKTDVNTNLKTNLKTNFKDESKPASKPTFKTTSNSSLKTSPKSSPKAYVKNGSKSSSKHSPRTRQS